MVAMTHAAFYDEPRRFSIVTALSKTVGVFVAMPRLFVTLALISVVPNVLHDEIMIARVSSSPAVAGAFAVAGLLLAYLVQAAMCFGTVCALRDKPLSSGTALRLALTRFVPILLASLLTMLLVGLASMALLVPGLMLLTALFVVIPACTIERLGPIASLRRSAALTKGSRWRVFGAFLIVMLAACITASAAALVVKMNGGLLVTALVLNLVRMIVGTLSGFFVAIVYCELRMIRDGVPVEPVSDTFG